VPTGTSDLGNATMRADVESVDAVGAAQTQGISDAESLTAFGHDPGYEYVRCITVIADSSRNPIGPDEVRSAESVVLVRMDHRPRHVRRADEEFSVAEGRERY
jgi:hypothetical protein